MCGRFNLRTTPGELIEIFDLIRAPEFSPRYNIAPTQPIVVVRAGQEGRVGDWLHWGLVPSWAQDRSIAAKMINARSETAAEKPAFRRAFKERRCLVPVSGFYEWETLAKGNKQPWHIHHRTEPVLAMAGLWETWTAPNGSLLESCAILTVPANPFMAQFHDRMPAILGADDWNLWIDPLGVPPDRLKSLLVPCPAEWLAREPVSTYVNNARHEGPECLQPPAKQGELFE